MLEKAYNAKKYEDPIYKAWEKSGLFAPRVQKSKQKGKNDRKPFSIMMPPPNATGTLHLGHAVMLALEDIMIRYHRMLGDTTLWVPGTDHAAIATNAKVEKILAEEGKTKYDLGRPAFVKKVKKFIAGSQDTIRNQIRKMGSSCDWTRERYTLEPALSEAVREIFVRMYNDGLIYRGNRIVNWCPHCESTLADDEVKYKEERAKFYYFKYGPFVIGTSRPETKFLDKVIVVHPKDKRYKKYIGTSIEVPWIEGTVKATILADKAADMEFGTGAMTITPAHDFTDFEIAKRHGLEVIKIIDEKGNLTEHAGEFAGRNAHDARDAIVEKMQKCGLVEKIDEDYIHNLSLCYRCGTPIEPLVSKQWFIDVDKKFGRAKKSLKQLSIEVVRSGKIKILPERFEKTYFHWMENLYDWCISRQIWFGHQIPVWYCSSRKPRSGDPGTLGCKEPIVAVKAPKKCPHCGGSKLEQDPDNLDTWFSSGLWTFSTLGWPKKTKDLETFHPTSVLETGYDILFFWIARMIIMTLYGVGEIPFKYVYLHGLVRTRDGKKMSKSDPETCIDPLDMIKKYGTDALRLSMVIGGAPGNDVRLYEEKIEGYRNFVNKIWNASRFALMQAEGAGDRGQGTGGRGIEPKTLADKWILTRTQEIIKEVTEDIEAFRFSEAGTKIYDFTWGEYCAWYLEISKGEHKNLPVLNYVLETILTLLHPFVPFVTEAVWKHLGKKEMLMAQEWPTAQKKFTFNKEADQMSIIVDIIKAVRNLRQECKINAGKRIHAVLVSKKWNKLLVEKRDAITRLAQLEKLEIVNKAPKIHPALTHYTNAGIEIILPLADLIDVGAERCRLESEKDNLEQYRAGLERKLKNKNFTDRAPTEIVSAEKAKLATATEKIKKIEAQLRNL